VTESYVHLFASLKLESEPLLFEIAVGKRAKRHHHRGARVAVIVVFLQHGMNILKDLGECRPGRRVSVYQPGIGKQDSARQRRSEPSALVERRVAHEVKRVEAPNIERLAIHDVSRGFHRVGMTAIQDRAPVLVRIEGVSVKLGFFAESNKARNVRLG